MRPPFPGMDPWLEHPAIWPDVHNSLISAIRDELAPRIALKYYTGLEQRVYALEPGELVFVGRPDIVVGQPASADVAYEPDEAEESTAVRILDEGTRQGARMADRGRVYRLYRHCHLERDRILHEAGSGQPG